MNNDVTLTNLTAERVKSNTESSYVLLKELYSLKTDDIDKTEDKIAKLSEKLVDMKFAREELGEQLNSLQASYQDYCKETGMEASFETFK